MSGRGYAQPGQPAPPSYKQEADRHGLLGALALLGALLLLASFLMAPAVEVWQGWVTILESPHMLLSDSLLIGGPAAAFFNAGVMTLLSCGLLYLLKSPVSGPAIGAVLIVTGFSFFGKHPLNAAPLVLGLLGFMRLEGINLGSAGVPALFSTALGPLVSAVALGTGLPLYYSIPLGVGLGLLAGFLLVPISRRALGFHAGYSLYNTGFAAGMMAMLIANLFRVLGLPLQTTLQLHAGMEWGMAVALAALFLLTGLAGWWLNGRNVKGYRKLLKESGRLTCDMVERHGTGLTLFNMGLCGLLALALPLITGAGINGPVLGAILTVYGFGAYGKHPLNCLPVMVGALVAGWLSIHDLRNTQSIIITLFATTLAPISGHYGPIAGVAAGFLHMALAHNLGAVQSGLNLYNNGFAGGFVGGMLPAIIEELRQLRPRNRRLG